MLLNLAASKKDAASKEKMLENYLGDVLIQFDYANLIDYLN